MFPESGLQKKPSPGLVDQNTQPFIFLIKESSCHETVIISHQQDSDMPHLRVSKRQVDPDRNASCKQEKFPSKTTERPPKKEDAFQKELGENEIRAELKKIRDDTRGTHDEIKKKRLRGFQRKEHWLIWHDPALNPMQKLQFNLAFYYLPQQNKGEIIQFSNIIFTFAVLCLGQAKKDQIN